MIWLIARILSSSHTFVHYLEHLRAWIWSLSTGNRILFLEKREFHPIPSIYNYYADMWTKLKNLIPNTYTNTQSITPLISHRKIYLIGTIESRHLQLVFKTPRSDLGIVRAIMRGYGVYGIRKACYNYTPQCPHTFKLRAKQVDR